MHKEKDRGQGVEITHLETPVEGRRPGRLADQVVVVV